MTSLQDKYHELFHDSFRNHSNHIPDGWKPILESLCEVLHKYMLNPNSTHEARGPVNSTVLWVDNALWKIHGNILSFLDPVTKFAKENRKNGIIFPHDSQRLAELYPRRIKFIQGMTKKFRKTSEFLQSILESTSKRKPPVTIDIFQIKEKFGGLRFYCQNNDPFVIGAIAVATEQCSKTCQITGMPGVLCSKNGWYQTLSESESRRLGFVPFE